MTAHGFTINRTLNATPDLVYSAWTEAEHLPPEMPTTVDLRIGGTWRLQMRETVDRAYVTGGIYRELEPGVRLSFTWGASGGFPVLTNSAKTHRWSPSPSPPWQSAPTSPSG